MSHPNDGLFYVPEELFPPTNADHSIILFDPSIFSLLVSILFTLVSTIRLLQLRARPIKTQRTSLIYFKSCTILSLVCLKIALFIMTITRDGPKPYIPIIAYFASSTAALMLLFLSRSEHALSIRPSLVINVYLMAVVALDITQLRSLWFVTKHPIRSSLTTSCIVFTAAILYLESIEKRSFLKDPYQAYPPEALGGMLSRSSFWWLNSLFAKGYRRILELDDLFVLDNELSSQQLQSRMRSMWQKSSHDRKNALMKATLSCFRLPLLKMIFPRLIVLLLKLCQPLLIRSAISLASQAPTPSKYDQGLKLIWATGVIYIGLAIANANYKHKIKRSVTMIRGGLISVIYDNTLLLDALSSHDSAAVTLMSTDIDRIVAGLEHCDNIWAAPIEITVALYLLWKEIGLPCIVPLGISIASAAAGYAVGSPAANAQRERVEAVQTRVSITASMLASMKGIKMMGLSGIFSDRVQGLKDFELKKSNKLRYITTVRNTISNFSLVMTPALTFVAYTTIRLRSSDKSFNAAKAFTSLSIIVLISDSVQWFVIAIFIFQTSLSCYTRIEKYIASRSRWDTRIIASSNSSTTNENVASLSQDVSEDTSAQDDHYSITVAACDSSYSIDGPSVIKDINFQLRPSTFTMILGPVGCGKSTLLKALLGEIPFTTGVIRLDTSDLGYCAQDPWLPNYTIRQNIVSFRNFEEQWYHTVRKACALDEDVKQFALGDESLVGSKGVSLSGGQKQRLTLARALYGRPCILLLDDILSGLDKVTQDAVFDQVLGPNGLCRKHRITVILVTHALGYFHYADQVIVLGHDGTISEQGPPGQLGHSIDKINKDLQKHDLSNGNSEEAQAPIIEQVRKLNLRSQESRRLEGDFKIYSYYASAIGWPLWAFLGLEVLATYFMRFSDVWLKWWSAFEVSYPGERTYHYLGIYCMLAVFALCVMALSILILFTRAIPRSSARLHHRLLRTVISAPYAYLSSTDTGVMLNRFSQDMSLIDTQLPTALLQTANGFMMCIAQVILITLSNRYMAPIVPVAITVLYVLQRFYLRTSRQIRLLDLELKSPLYAHFLETLSGLQTIRAFGWKVHWNERSCQLLDQSQRPIYLLYCIQRWLELALDGMVAICAIVVITLATQIEHTSATAGGALGVALVNLLNLSSMLSYLVRAWAEMETSIGAVMRIRDFESNTPSEHSEAVVLTEPPLDWPTEGRIEFNSVDATYEIEHSEEGPNHCPDLVLNDITLSILPRSHVGFCGRTGSGKSSLLLTLFQMIDVVNGSILIDGIDIRRIPRSTLRQRILCVPQSPELFPGTIRDNLDPFEDHTDNAIVSVLKTVGLWTMLEARGGLRSDSRLPLSSGERQIFALAYALLRQKAFGRNSGVLILDEFSASVDVDTERRIIGIVQHELRGWTVLSVAHRLEAIKNCDLVVSMDRGKVVEVGKPGTMRTVDFKKVGSL